jgi:hypothetical protein
MIRFAADESLNRKLVTGLQRRAQRLDIGRVQNAGLRGAVDRTVLAWAAGENRILLTDDVTTMSRYAYNRVEARLAHAWPLRDTNQPAACRRNGGAGSDRGSEPRRRVGGADPLPRAAAGPTASG